MTPLWQRSAHIERGLAHGSALSLDLSHFRLRILGCNKNMKISRSLKIMNPITLITPKKFSGLRSCKMLRSVPTHFFVYCYCVMRLFTVLSNPVGRYLPRFFKSVVSSDSIDSAKGQIKLKADWRAIDSPKKRTNEFGFFCFTVRKYLKLEMETSSFK